MGQTCAYTRFNWCVPLVRETDVVQPHRTCSADLWDLVMASLGLADLMDCGGWPNIRVLYICRHQHFWSRHAGFDLRPGALQKL
jgi:hypothetical protein